MTINSDKRQMSCGGLPMMHAALLNKCVRTVEELQRGLTGNAVIAEQSQRRNEEIKKGDRSEPACDGSRPANRGDYGDNSQLGIKR